MDEQAMEMDEIQSQYSSAKPASTILTGFPGRGPYMPPQSPGPFVGGNVAGNRNSHMSNLSRYTDYPQFGGHPGANASRMSVGNLSAAYPDQPYHSSRHSIGITQSSENLLGNRSRSPLGQYPPRPASTAFDYSAGPSSGPDEHMITDAIRGCLAEVDLDTVTKKQGMSNNTSSLYL